MVETTDNRKTDFNSVGLGCLWGGLISLIFLVIGIVFEAVFYPKPSVIHSGVEMGVFFLIQVAGFGLASWIFLHWAAPNVTIHGFAGLPDITIASKNKHKGFRNIKLVKTLLGGIGCIIVFLFGLALFGFAYSLNTILPILVFFIFIILGPVIAIILFKMTDFSISTHTL
ncbi:MAG: hypothetical protein P4L50_23810 [Anaerolineaceae bacterium]|nr:hypothetical protein [Anaerolineaceae bacterium]